MNSNEKPLIINHLLKHIAIIMDGNARWAKLNNLSLYVGHKTGSENIKNIAQSCIDVKVKYLTLYAFSMENWQRPKAEVAYLLKLIDNYLEKDIKEFMDMNVAIKISGDLSKLSKKTQSKIIEIEESTANNNSLILNIAFSYGSRNEIVEAVKKLVLAVERKEINFSQINEDLFSRNLYQPIIPDPDLLIRTGGDFRVSNFLLWQLAYTELYFTEVLWPDFNKNHLHQAIIEFNKRERKYGKR